MLLPREQSPWNCGYFLGAVALRAIGSSAGLDVEELRERMSTELGKPLSVNQVMSAVAWLYLIDAIAMNPQGKVVRCT